jgi:hypothetical protein
VCVCVYVCVYVCAHNRGYPYVYETKVSKPGV